MGASRKMCHHSKEYYAIMRRIQRIITSSFQKHLTSRYKKEEVPLFPLSYNHGFEQVCQK